MPRRTISLGKAVPEYREIAEKLREALAAPKPSGQPMIYEEGLAPNRLKVTVIWDEWQLIPLEDRASVILKGYELAEGPPYREKITLAIALTMPEATAAGMLPYQVATALRKDDPVTLEECRKAMLAEGASTSFGPQILQLRFPTRDEAEACRLRLIQKLPKSENVWIIQIDVSVQDYQTLHETVA